MSTIDKDDIERTKQQIRGLVNEIANLAKAELSAEDFYAGFLQRVVQALAAAGGAVWVLGEGRRLNLQYQINIQPELMNPDSAAAGRHFRLLQQVLTERAPQLAPPLSGSAEENGPGNPTEHLLVLAPLTDEDQPAGVVEVFQRPNSPPATQRGYLRFLLQMCDMASEWMKSQKLKQFSDRHSLWAQADHFARQVHDTLDVRETCYTITNEGRRLIGCDRVTIALQKGRRCKVEAVSGQDTIEGRSNIIYHLNDLASKVVATGEPLWYSGSTENLPPQIETALDNYIEESYSREIIVLPLRKPKTAEMRADESARAEATLESNEANETIGALILEQIETNLPRDILEPRIDLVYEHSARALAAAIDYNSLFLMPVWRAIGKTRTLTAARNLPKTLSVAAAVLIILGVLFFVPADFNLKASGALQPIERHEVFVMQPGFVDDLKVGDQQQVVAGELLAVMRNSEFELQITEKSRELGQAQRRLELAESERRSRGITPERRIELTTEMMEYETLIDNLTTELELLAKRQKELEIRAPISGTVLMSWDVEKSITRRTVEPGQSLMTIADLSQQWEVELDMPERRVGHVLAARQDPALGPDLKVSYVLATDPRKSFHGKAIRYDQITRIDEKEGQVVRIRVEIDKQQHLDYREADLRPGATVTGKVYCGKRSLGYTWFHEAWEWVQSNLLF